MVRCLERQDYIFGEWVDSNGSINSVRFKKKWGEHIFSEDEINRLLQGEVITFRYKEGMIQGHLQYKRTQEGVRYFGFCPDFDSDYTDNPLYDLTVGSKFEMDRKNEILMNRFMRIYYYSKLINSDGSKVKSEYISDESRQKQGVDVILLRDQKKYVIDEKAQLDYIYNADGPLNTFSLELLSSASGNIGWFINDKLRTEYYMFIWPHADGRLISVNDIEYAHYALVERSRLKKKLEREYLSMGGLLEYAVKLSEGNLKGAIEQFNKLYYKDSPFDNNAYLVFTKEPSDAKKGKVEKPVNLVVKKTLIEKIAEEKGTLRRSSETDGGVM